jgi:hypothetical protein
MKVELRKKEFKENTFEIYLGDIFKGEIIIDEVAGVVCIDIYKHIGQDFQVTEH